MDELLLVAVVVVVVVGIPVAAVVALVRTSSHAEELEQLRRQMAELGRRLNRLGDRLDATQAAPRQADESVASDPTQDEAVRRTPEPTATHSVRGGHPGLRAPVASRVAPGPEDATVESGADDGEVEAGDAAAAEHTSGTAEARERSPAEAHADTGVPEAPKQGAEPREEAATGATAGAQGSGPSAGSLDFETLIGTTWVLRIGLGILAIALALFARTVAPQLDPWAKVVVAYLGAMALFGVGMFYEKKLERFARPVMAGGLAFGFFVAFAAYSVPAMRAVSLSVSIGWMVMSMGTVLVAAERWNSQPTAALAILLGHVSGFVAASQADTYSLSIIAFLALTAAVLVLRHQWFELGVVAVVLSYGAHLLWILADRGPTVGDGDFWLNLAFLTSYYVVFLIADVLWWRRHGEGASSEGGGSIVSPRYLGPTNLVLYVSLTSFVYVATDAHLASIEWFYIALGAVQGVLAWLYRGAHHRDYVFYPAFGTILWTLGMFAALDALSLNLVIAGQALLLLLAAHRTRLWVFHALAQAALLVAFVHYWTYPVPAQSGWPLFIGGLGLVAVYMVKASLEEMWYGDGDAPDWVESGTAHGRRGTAERAFGRFFAPIAPKLAYFHAGIAGLVLVRESRAHFGWDRPLAVFIALAGLLMVGIVLARRRTALLFALSVTAAASVVLVALRGDPASVLGAVGAGSSTSFLLLFGLAVAALCLGVGVPARLDALRAGEAALHGQALIVLAMVGAFAAAAVLTLTFPGDAIWLAIPVAALAFQELVRTGVPAGEPAASGRAAEDERASLSAHALGIPVAVGAAFVMVRLIGAGVGMEPLGVVWVAAGTAVLLAVAALRSGGAFGIGGYTLMIAGYGLFLLSDDVLTATILSTLWVGAVATVVPLGVAVVFDTLATDGEGNVGLEGTDATTLAAYALGLLLLGGLAYAQLPVGWAQLAPALFGLGLVAVPRRFGLVRAVPAVVVALLFLHAFFLGSVSRTEAVAGALWLVILFGLVTFVTERLMGDLTDRKPGPNFARTMSGVLVAAATLTIMAAIYRSSLFGALWATAGWSLLAGLLMGAGFALRSSLHRRTALIVLAACLVRVFVVDTRGLSSTAQIGAFFVLGLILLAVGLLYSKYSERMKDWL